MIKNKNGKSKKSGKFSLRAAYLLYWSAAAAFVPYMSVLLREQVFVRQADWVADQYPLSRDGFQQPPFELCIRPA